MQRPVISYDDITLPYEPQVPREGFANSPSNTSHSKKRKWSSQKPTQNKSSKSVNGPAAEEADEEDDLDSRLLASEEIWDDSALIDAWDAAMEEYEALNGPDKGWKNEPVHKSPLWYNVPPSKPPKKKIKTADATAGAGVDMEEEEGDSNPIDFATFVPTHDASLAPPARAGDAPAYDFGALPSGALTASQDEAFERALNATYWGGYWTAVYHCHRRTARLTDAEAERESEYGDEDGENVDDGTGDKESEQEEFVPTQR